MTTSKKNVPNSQLLRYNAQAQISQTYISDLCLHRETLGAEL